MPKGFDHIVIVSDDLERDAEAFHQAGFSVTRRSDPPGGPAQSLLICLADGSYIELFAFRDTAYRARHRWRDVPPGVWADYSLATDRLFETCARLRQAGLDVPEPADFRKVLADGTEWACRTVHPGRDKGPAVLPFLVQDLTPRHLRVPTERIQHGNGATAIVGCTLLTADLMAAGAHLASLCADHAETGPATKRFSFGNCWIDLVQPQNPESETARHLREHGDGLWSLTLASDQGQRVFTMGKARIEMIACPGSQRSDDA